MRPRRITPAQRAEIRRLYYGKHWKLGTIAATTRPPPGLRDLDVQPHDLETNDELQRHDPDDTAD